MAKLEKRIVKQKAKAKKRAAKAERKQHERKAQAVLTRAQIADQLRALAAQIEEGTFVLGDKEVALPEEAEYEIGYRLQRRGGHEIEVEIEWGGRQKTSLLLTG
ncbi:MAG: amphi-Trp domain-containing protein [Anaerolineae bacterium]|nr:amphi-Trp domain-containing protein [Anaerolineae bacterium]